MREFPLARRMLFCYALSLVLRCLALLRYSLAYLGESFLYGSARLRNLEHRVGRELHSRVGETFSAIRGKYQLGSNKALLFGELFEARVSQRNCPDHPHGDCPKYTSY